MRNDIEAFLREAEGSQPGTTEMLPTSEPSQERPSPTKVKAAAKKGKDKGEVKYRSMKIPESVAHTLEIIQMSYRSETAEKLPLGVIIERVLETGIEPAFGEKVARKVAKMK